MTCRFLDNLSIRTLVAPVAEEEFRSQYWEQKPLIIHRGDPDYYKGLFSLEEFDEAITRTPDYVKMANNKDAKKNASYKAKAVAGLEATFADMREGSTLVLDQLHHSEPKLGALCRILGPEFGHRFQINLYLTPPNGVAFSPHWDNHDVFILQLLGSKHWKIDKDRRAFPLKEEKVADGERVHRGDLNDFILNQGDLIYIPRGYVHSAACGQDPSLHITLGVTAFFFEDFLYAAVKAAIQRDERLRVTLPLGYMLNGGPQVLNRAISVFREISDQKFLTEVADQFRDEMVTQFPIDVSRTVVDHFQPLPLKLADIVGPRRGLAYRLHIGGDSVRLNIGTRSIVFLEIFRDALQFALQTPEFSVRELPGDLEDEERLVFIERLILEGILIRKLGHVMAAQAAQ